MMSRKMSKSAELIIKNDLTIIACLLLFAFILKIRRTLQISIAEPAAIFDEVSRVNQPVIFNCYQSVALETYC